MDKLAFKTWLESLGPDYVFQMGNSLSLNCPLAKWLTASSGRQMYVGLSCGWEVGKDRPTHLPLWAQDFRYRYDNATGSAGTAAEALRVLELISTPEIVS